MVFPCLRWGSSILQRQTCVYVYGARERERGRESKRERERGRESKREREIERERDRERGIERDMSV